MIELQNADDEKKIFGEGEIGLCRALEDEWSQHPHRTHVCTATELSFLKPQICCLQLQQWQTPTTT